MEGRNLHEVLAIANEINQQIGWSANLMIQLSWGVSKKAGFLYKDMPTLAMKVNGLLHKDWVYISLNEGRDTYEIRLMDGNKEIKLVEDVYCDNLGIVLDNLIEKEISTSDEEYQKNVEQHYIAQPL